MSAYNWSGSIEPVFCECVDAEVLEELWKACRIRRMELKQVRKHKQQKRAPDQSFSISSVMDLQLEKEG
jgi:hypothetical protein